MNKYEHKVQYYETDQMGVVHHSNYIRWFEEARSFILEEAGFGYDKMEQAGIISPVLEVNAKYRTMTRYGDVVEIESMLTEYNGIKMTLEYVVRDKATGEIRCTGESKHCFLNRENQFLSLKREHPEIDAMIRGLMTY
jgi:acyl-CoA thioester hydrolase